MHSVDSKPGSQRSGMAGTALSDRLNNWCNAPWMIWLLVIAGAIRAVILLLAYPPAHGPDSLAYFLYAERLAGQDFPLLAQLVPPLYPYLILIAYKWLGSAYWLIALQVVMAVSIAPLYYFGLRRYSPILAVLTSVVIVADVQHGIMFNFMSTEPLYAFLLACLVFALLTALKPEQRALTDGRLFLAVGGVVALLFLTRPVAKFMIVPVALLVWVVIRHWRPPALTILGFGAVLAAYALVSLIVVGQVEGFSSGMYMALRPTVLQERAQIRAGALTDSPLADCQRADDTCLAERIAEDSGAPANEAAVRDLSYIWGRARDYLLGDQFRAYLARVSASTLDFLSLGGQQYGYDRELPAEAQCAASEARPEGITPEWFRAFHASWALPDDPEMLETLRDIVPPITAVFCPPRSNVPALRSVVDYVAFRYRSLARPEHQLLFWYGGVFLMAVVMPSARRYLPLLLTLALLLLYHALISAVSLNVQPRYVVVTNPFRASLLSAMFFLVAQAGVALFQQLRARWRPSE